MYFSFLLSGFIAFFFGVLPSLHVSVLAPIIVERLINNKFKLKFKNLSLTYSVPSAQKYNHIHKQS